MAKGDRKMIKGAEHESLGPTESVDPKGPPSILMEKQFWVPVKKAPEGFPMMRKGGKIGSPTRVSCVNKHR